MVSSVRGAILIVALLCWAMSLYKLRDLVRDPNNRPLRALCFMLVGASMVTTIQPLMPALDQFLGVLDLARVTSNCLSLVCATATQSFLLYMTSSDAPGRRQARRRMMVLAATVAIIIALFVMTPAATTLSDPRVASGAYYGDPYNTPVLYAYLAYLGWSLGEIAILARQYARIAHRPLLRFGLRLIALGALWGLVYAVAKLVAVAAGALWPASALITDAVVVVSFTTAILLMLIGSTIPSWGPRVGLDQVWNWAAALQDCYRLRPLWTAIHQVLPEIALLPMPHGIRGALAIARDASLRRVRLTVEILDGYAILRPWMSGKRFTQARAIAEQAGLVGDRLGATVEAAVIGTALAARQQGRPPATDADAVPPLPIGSADRRDIDNADAAKQVTWLIQVARAYRSSAVFSILAQPTPTVTVSSTASER